MNRDRTDTLLGGLAALGVLAVLATALVAPKLALQGWLAAEIGWTLPSLGCLLLMLSRRLVGAPAIPAVTAAALTMPVAGLGFVPLLLLFPANAAFAGRSLGYFVVWILLARFPVAIIGLVLVTVSASLASTDWLLALDPGFHSSVYGLMTLAQAALVGWALATTSGEIAPPQAAGLMIGGIALWAYLCFCQYLVVWNANEPAEIAWVLRRQVGGWGTLYWASSVLEGVVPFLFLLPRRMRASRRAVTTLAGVLVVGGLAQAAVLTLPAFGPSLAPGLAALPAMLGLGGIWLLVFRRRLEAAHG
jgi:hypothetical protein